MIKHQKTEWSAHRQRTDSGSSLPVRYFLYLLTLLVDSLMIVGGFAAGTFARFGELQIEAWAGVLAILQIFFICCAVSLGAYSTPALRSLSLAISRSLASLLAAYLLLSFTLYVLKSGEEYSRLAMSLSVGFAGLFLIASRIVLGKLVARLTAGRLTNEVLLVESLDDVAHMEGLDKSACKIFELGSSLPGLNVDDVAAQISFATLTRGADRIVVACRRSNQELWMQVLRSSNAQGEILLTDTSGEQPVGIGTFLGQKTLLVTKGGLTPRQRIAKRLFDIFVAGGLLIFSSIVMVCIAIAIKLDSKGPVFFRQERLGRGNVPFQILKFRTMRHQSSDKEGLVSTSRGDQRVTTVGRWLRATSLDELPQFFNVLSGHMSIVGPRPHALGSTAENLLFWQVDRRYWTRHVLKPGITGLAQVRGQRGATETVEHLKARLQSDLEYVTEWSLGKDVAIVVRTLQVVVHSNAY